MVRRTVLALFLGLGSVLGLLVLVAGGHELALADPGILYVALAGDCGGATPCYATIQAAVDAANSGDVIKVAQGTYNDVHHIASLDTATFTATQIVAITRELTLRGGHALLDWDVSDPNAHPTIMDADGKGRVLVIIGAIAPTIEGLRLTGGDAAGLGGTSWGDVGGGVYVANAAPILSDSVIYSNTAYVGGGLFLSRSSAILSNNTIVSNTAVTDAGGLHLNASNATLRHNTISGNTGRGWGGGVMLSSSSALLSGNTIASNSAVHGGGVCIYWSGATLDGNLISGNQATSGGGALLYHSDALLRGNLVSGNTAGMGGGLELDGRSPTLINNVVADNQASGAAGIRIIRATPRLLHTTIARNALTGGAAGSGDGVHIDNYSTAYSTVVMTNTIITGHDAGIRVREGNTVTLNATLWHGNTSDWAGAGTINHSNDHYGNPAFAADGYHLTAGSAAIDRGVDAGVTTDIDGDARPRNKGYDLGADEFTGTPALRSRIYTPLILRNWQL